MKAYVYSGKGRYLGSTVIVIAKSMKTALNLINIELQNMWLSDEIADKDNVEVIDVNEPKVIYSYDGDY